MRQSELFSKPQRDFPKDEEALNARLLIRAGFIDKVMAGVYSFLPLGLKTLRKIENVIREEMDAIGAQEILMPALHPKEYWERTGRWDALDVLFKVRSRYDAEYALGPTHEEIIVPLAKKFLFSYKDLPFGAYQIQTKFRDEARSKSGLLRGREFRMKDLYSFHRTPEDLLAYYERAKAAYGKIFTRVGLEALVVEASGGTFSKYSHEFQVLAESGEDAVYLCGNCGFAKNREIVDEELAKIEPGGKGTCPSCGGALEVKAGIEVGNIFQLNRKFSDPFALSHKDEKGELQPVYMGCYGIGPSRVMGTIAEVSSDERGLAWPEEVAPFQAHLIELPGGEGAPLYRDLQAAGIEVLYDERNLSAGEKFAEADLLGIPWRAVVSAKTGDKVEVKPRKGESPTLMTGEEFLAKLGA